MSNTTQAQEIEGAAVKWAMYPIKHGSRGRGEEIEDISLILGKFDVVVRSGKDSYDIGQFYAILCLIIIIIING